MSLHTIPVDRIEHIGEITPARYRPNNIDKADRKRLEESYRTRRTASTIVFIAAAF